MKFSAFLTEFTTMLRRVRLKPQTRERMRERLAAYADLHQVVQKTKEQFSFMRYLSVNLMRTGFALLLVLVGAGGVAYASYDTVPGQTLYGVKVGVVEPLESALLVDPKSRATWNAMLAERRLTEAATLAVKDKLTEEHRTYLQDQFETFATRADSAADEVRAEGDVATALMLRSDLEARLTAHADLISYLTTDDVNPESEPKQLLAVVARTRDAVAAERQETETEATARAVAYGDDQIRETERVTEEVARLARVTEGGVVSGNIEARLNAARLAIANARVSLAQNENGGAYVAAQAATRLTQEAAILAKNKGIVAEATDEAPASVMMLSAPAAKEMEDTGTSTATTTDEKKEGKNADEKNEKKSSYTDTPSPDSHDQPAEKIIESVKSLIGL